VADNKKEVVEEDLKLMAEYHLQIENA